MMSLSKQKIFVFNDSNSSDRQNNVNVYLNGILGIVYILIRSQIKRSGIFEGVLTGAFKVGNIQG